MSTVVACWHPAADARAALRRAIPRRRGWPPLRICRSSRALSALVHTGPVDAVIGDPRSASGVLFDLAADYGAVPVFGYAGFRAADGALLRQCREGGLAGVFVQGVDDAALGYLVLAGTASARRRRALADAPRLLRLSEPLQLAAWEEVLRRATRPTRTAELAVALRMTREHLSRQFGAGGAPNLKRVIDLARAACAADLLQSRAHTVKSVARILGYASAAHLSGTARRVTGENAPGLRTLGVRGVLERFLAGRTRSRL